MTQSELKQLLEDFPYDDKGRFPFEEVSAKQQQLALNKKLKQK